MQASYLSIGKISRKNPTYGVKREAHYVIYGLWVGIEGEYVPEFSNAVDLPFFVQTDIEHGHLQEPKRIDDLRLFFMHPKSMVQARGYRCVMDAIDFMRFSKSPSGEITWDIRARVIIVAIVISAVDVDDRNDVMMVCRDRIDIRRIRVEQRRWRRVLRKEVRDTAMLGLVAAHPAHQSAADQKPPTTENEAYELIFDSLTD
jgi:hypothetical protein